MKKLLNIFSRETHETSGRKIGYTKYFLGLITCLTTILALPLIRIELKANSIESTVAAAVYWVVVSFFGFIIIVYPWWLATSSSPIYYNRLQKYTKLIAFVSFVLVAARSLTAPAEPFQYEKPGKTTLAFKLVSGFWWISSLFGFLLLLPVLIRREKLFRSKSLALFTFVIPYVMVMFAGVVLHEWTGNGMITAYSPLVLIVLYYVVVLLEGLAKPNKGSKSQFDEAYIMVAGFVPFWLGSVLGGSLLVLVSTVGPLGTVVIFGAWRMLIFVFEVISAETGSRASRTADGSVFAFCAIYTGATYAEFIFLSVVFNSVKFWALLAIEVMMIVFWYGGMMIDINDFVVEYVPSNCYLLRMFKTLFINFYFTPYEIAQEAAKRPGSQANAEIQLALIRSRAMVVQITWTTNDIKMASEFQSLACAATAVAADIFYSYYNVGEDFIPESIQTKRELMYIYLVNLAALFLAQAMARRQLKNKVGNLKKDIRQVVARVVSERRKGARVSMESIHSEDSRVSGLTTNPAFGNPERLESRTSSRDLDVSSGSMETEKQNDRSSLKNFTKMLPDLQGMMDRHKSTSGQTRAQSEVDEEEEAFNDLCNILEMTAKFAPPEKKETSENRRRSSNFLSYDFYGTVDDIPADEDEFAADDWGDVDIVTSGGGGRRMSISSPPMEGYLKKQKPGSTRYQRRYFLLTSRNMLLYYSDKSDVTDHVGSAKGVIALADVTSLNQSSSSPCDLELVTPSRVYRLQAYTVDEAMMWYGALYSRVGGKGDKENNSDINVRLLEEGGGEGVTAPSHMRRGSIGVRRASASKDPDIALSVTIDDLPEKRGMLKRKNMFFYQERWVELRRPGLLSWYTSYSEVESNHETHAGTISTSDIISVQQIASNQCFFDVDVKGRTYQFQADSEGLAKEWCEALSAWVQHYAVEMEFARHRAGSTVRLVEDVVDVDWLRRSSFFMAGRKSEDMDRDSLAMMKFSRRNTRRASLVVRCSDVENEINVDVSRLPERKGWVRKKGGRNAVWQRRWIQISQPGILSWYVSDKDALEGQEKAKGSIEICNILSVEQPHTDLCCIDVNVKGRTYELQTYTLAEARGWCDDLAAWMTYHSSAATHCRSTSVGHSYRRSGVQNRNSGHDFFSDIDETIASLPEKKGYLMKRGVGHTNWQQRWFELIRPGKLLWYNSERSASGGHSKAKGKLQMLEVLSVELSPSEPSRLDIDVKGRTYELQAFSTEEAKEWLSVFIQWVEEISLAIDVNSAQALSKFGAESVDIAPEDALIKRSSLGYLSGKRVSSTAEYMAHIHNDDFKARGVQDLPEKKGYMLKKGGNNGTWQKRWVEVVQPGDFCWFGSENESHRREKVKGSFSMFEVLSVDQRPQNCVNVSIDGRTYEFQIFNSEEYNEWLRVLTAWTNFCSRSMSSSIGDSLPMEDKVHNDYFDSLPEKSGFMKKRGGIGSTIWQRRWFELRRPGILSWFNSDEEASQGQSKLKGSISLSDVLMVALSKDDPCDIDLDVKGRTYQLQTYSDVDARGWCDILNAWMEYYQSQHEGQKRNTDGSHLSANCGIDSSVPVDSDHHSSSKSPPLEEKKGVLKKKGGSHGGWQQRWCELTDPGVLSYYVSESDAANGPAKAKGYIALPAVLAIQRATCDTCTVEVVVKGRVYEFQAPTESEANAWYACLCAWKEYAREHAALFDPMNLKLPLPPVVERLGSSDSCVSEPFPDDMTDLPEHSGFLKKYGGSNRNSFQTRWFYLRKPGVLEWFDSDADAGDPDKVKGSIRLDDILMVNQSSEDICCIDVDLKGSTYQLQAYSVEEAQEWYEVMQRWLEYMLSKEATAQANENLPQKLSFRLLKFTTDLKLRTAAEMTPQGTSERDTLSKPAKMSGQLKKKGGSHGSWQQRWCEITHPGVLSYYGSERDAAGGLSKAKGFISLTDVLSVSRSSSDSCTIDVAVRGRVYEFQAASVDIADEWLACVVKWAEYAYLDKDLCVGISSRFSIGSEWSSVSKLETEAPNTESFMGLTEKCGYVKKMGGGSQWQQRWMVIQSPGILFWYSSETDAKQGQAKANGALTLSDILSVELTNGDPCRFDVDIKGRTYQFQAYSSTDARAWYDVLLNWTSQCASARNTYTIGDNSLSFRRICTLDSPVAGSLYSSDKPSSTISGVLNKKSGSHGNWQQRWCEVTEPGILSYYASREDMTEGLSKARGSVVLTDVLSVNKSSSDVNVIEIAVKGRVYEFQGCSEEESARWLGALVDWTKYACHNTSAFGELRTRLSVTEKMPMEVEQPHDESMKLLTVKQGYVKKKGGKNNQWQQRWLELQHPGTLSWYATEVDAQQGLKSAKGHFAISDVLLVELSKSEPCRFDVDVKGRTYQMQAYSEEEAQVWYAALMEWMRYFASRDTLNLNQADEASADRNSFRRTSVLSGPVVDRDSQDFPRLSSNTPEFLQFQDSLQLEKMSGQLKKKGGSHGSWQQRWCEITHPGVLSYYGSERDAAGGLSKAKGFITLGDVLSINRSLEDSCIIDITVKGRVYEFRANNEDMTEQWLKALTSWTEYACQHKGLFPSDMPKSYRSSLGRASLSSNRLSDLSLDNSCERESYCPVGKKGFLKKRGGSNGNVWQRRWFEVQYPGELSWYIIDGATRKLKGSIMLADVLSVQTSLSDSCRVDVNVKGRTYELQAYAEDDAIQWADALTEWVKFVQPGRLSLRHSTLTMTDYKRPSLQDMPEKHGLIKKKGGVWGNSWQQRWVEIRRPGVLVWYLNEDDAKYGKSKEKGSLLLSSILSADQSTVFPECFDVNVKGKSFEFQTSSSDEAYQWTAVLEQWAAYLDPNAFESDESESPMVDEKSAAAITKKPFNDRNATSRGLSKRMSDLQTVDELGEDDFSETDNELEIGLRDVDVCVDDIIGNEGLKCPSDDQRLAEEDEEVQLILHEIVDKVDEDHTQTLVREECRLVLDDILNKIVTSVASDACLVPTNEENLEITDDQSDSKIYSSEMSTDAIVNDTAFSRSAGQDTDMHKEASINIDSPSDKASYPLVHSTVSDEICEVPLVSGESENGNGNPISTASGNSVIRSSTTNEGELPSTTSPTIEGLYEAVEASPNHGQSNVVSTVPDSGYSCDDEIPTDLSTSDLKSSHTLSRLFRGTDGDGSGVYKRLSSGNSFGSGTGGDDYVVVKQQDAENQLRTKLSRESSVIPKAWDPDLEDMDSVQYNEVCVEEEVIETRTRRASDCAHREYMKLNSQTDDDDFMNKLRTNSYQDLNKKFWVKHKWYLTAVVCYVTLHVLHVTSFIIRERE